MINNTSLILLMSGDSIRFGEDKLFFKVDSFPLYQYSLKPFMEIGIKNVVVVLKEERIKEVKKDLSILYPDVSFTYIIGGATRSESVKNGLKAVDKEFVLIHDAARPIVKKEDILTLLASSTPATLCAASRDSLGIGCTRLVREEVRLIYTPQLFSKKEYATILNNTELVFDEAALFDNTTYVETPNLNLKLTFKEDKDLIAILLKKEKEYRNGLSFDFHPFSESGTLVLGGLKFDDYPKLAAHSDGDVILHSIAEAILGAINHGDLGSNFPDTDKRYEGITSSILLKEVLKLLDEASFEIVNIDVMVYLEKPRLDTCKVEIEDNIKKLINNPNVSIKAASLNQGSLALKNGIGSQAIVLLRSK